MYSIHNNDINNTIHHNNTEVCSSTININQNINLQHIKNKLNYNSINVYKSDKKTGYIFINIPYISDDVDINTIHLNF
jgi:hypothetical protein